MYLTWRQKRTSNPKGTRFVFIDLFIFGGEEHKKETIAIIAIVVIGIVVTIIGIVITSGETREPRNIESTTLTYLPTGGD